MRAEQIAKLPTPETDKYVRWSGSNRVVGETLSRSLEQRLAAAVVALKWYADPVAYSMPVQDIAHHVFPDMGKTARDALAAIKERK